MSDDVKINMDNNNQPWIPETKPMYVVSALSEVVDWGLKMLGVPDWWKVTQGENVKIALLDTGVCVDHPDLKDNIKECCDFTGSSAGFIDLNGHGSHCAGIICALANNLGVVGVAPKIGGLYVGKVLGDNGCGNYDEIAAGIDWAISKNVEIISLSLGSPLDNSQLYNAIKRAYNKGIIIVAAAGNDGNSNGDNINYPSKYYPEVIAVGSIDQNMTRPAFSSVGKELTVVAPGGRIYSTYLNNAYAVLSGSSMACPFVSAYIALLISFHKKSTDSKTPIRNVDDVREHLARYAIKPQDYSQNKYGFGIINPEAMLKDS